MEKRKDLIGISFIIQVPKTGEKKEVIVWVSIRILADVAALIIDHQANQRRRPH